MRRFTPLLIAVVASTGAGPLWAQSQQYLDLLEILKGPGFGSRFSASIGSGARALAMGGAFIAVADDGTAASWNPAGLCVLERPEASLVSAAVNDLRTDVPGITDLFNPGVGGEYYRTSPYSLTQSGSAFDFVSLAYPVRRGRWKVVPQFSFRRAINVGLDTRASPFLSDNANMFYRLTGSVSLESSASGGIDVYATSIGVSFREDLFLGTSLNLWRGSPESRSTERTIRSDTIEVVTVAERESLRGFNVDVGALYRLTDQVRLAAVYKTPFSMHRTLKREGVDLLSILPGSSADRFETFARFVTDEEKGDIQWPTSFGFGAAYAPSNTLTLSADFTWSNWSNAVYEFDRASSFVDFHPPSPFRIPFVFNYSSLDNEEFWPTGADASSLETPTNLHQSNTRQIRFGVERIIVKPKLWGLTALPLRGGIFSDQQYFKESGLEPVSYVGLTAGFGFVWSRFSLDLAYVHKSGRFRSRDAVVPTRGAVSIVSSDANHRFNSNQLYLSAIVRF